MVSHRLREPWSPVISRGRSEQVQIPNRLPENPGLHSLNMLIRVLLRQGVIYFYTRSITLETKHTKNWLLLPRTDAEKYVNL